MYMEYRICVGLDCIGSILMQNPPSVFIFILESIDQLGFNWTKRVVYIV